MIQNPNEVIGSNESWTDPIKEMLSYFTYILDDVDLKCSCLKHYKILDSWSRSSQPNVQLFQRIWTSNVLASNKSKSWTHGAGPVRQMQSYFRGYGPQMFLPQTCQSLGPRLNRVNVELFQIWNSNVLVSKSSPIGHEV